MNASVARDAIALAIAIEGERDFQAVQARTRSAAASFGYDRYVLYAAAPATEDVVSRIYWVEGDWFGTGEGVDAVTYVRHCPVARHIVDASEPFFWTKTETSAGPRYRVVAHPHGHGIHGLQVPVFGSSGLEGAFSCGGLQVDSSPVARATLSLIGTAAFLAARRLLEALPQAPDARLSAREREILAWVSSGKRQSDIAASLGLSERTVENHLRRIRKRLGASTTAQAIRFAIRHGQIDN